MLGSQMYQGKFSQKCHTDGEATDQVCYLADYCSETEPDCGPSKCEAGQTCEPTGKNPNSDVTSFDNIFTSMLTIFVCMTLEGWSDTMYHSRDVTDTLQTTDLYYVVLVIIGGFVILNLTIAVLYMNFH